MAGPGPREIVVTEYSLSMPVPHSQLFEVELRIPAAGAPIEAVMPVWTPGSYLVREFARNVQDLTAHDASGQRLACRKSAKHTWRIEGAGAGPVVIRYRVYANELTVRTSHLDASHGYVNGASVFLFVRGMEDEPIRLRVNAPEGWRTATSLRETEAGEFLAADYDELVDSPLEIGPHRTIAWAQEDRPHRFVIWGRGAIDDARLEADTRRIISVCSEMFGGLPYDSFLFLLHLVPEGGGGLEHRASTSLQFPAAALEDNHEGLLALVAHEFFHVWLGKRIRPEPLGPFDYTAENYSRQLWVVEGFTTYYTDLILVRAGLITPERYLERLADSIARLWSTPGRRHQTLEESSFDSWIRFYRPDAHTPNSQVSYYHKGSLVALAFDMEIRRASGGRRSLDDVMRLLWSRFGEPDRGMPEVGPGGIQDVISDVYAGDGGDREAATREVERLFDAYVSGLEEIDFDSHLSAVGLRTERVVTETMGRSGGGSGGRRAKSGLAHDVWPGMRLREEGGRIRVAHVLEGMPAADAGVNAGDEILAVNGARARRDPGGGLAGVALGEGVGLTLIRRGDLVTIEVPAADPRAVGWVGAVRIVAAGTATGADGEARVADAAEGGGGGATVTAAVEGRLSTWLGPMS